MRWHAWVLVLCAGACGSGAEPVWRTVTAGGDGTPYRLLAPEGTAAGVVLLLGVPPEAALPRLLVARRYAVVEPAVSEETMFLDGGSLVQLARVVTDARVRSGAPPGRIAVGGVSVGGTGAVRYAQYCAQRGCESAGAPRAVFAVDAPLDMERLWRSTAAVLARAWEGSNLAESRSILDRLSSQLGGSPSEHRAAYASRSPYLYFEPGGGNARLLRETALRLYTEPDIGYWIETRRFDYFNLNAFDAAGLVNRLRLAGNAEAELVVSSGRGVRPSGERNPHSWSIVDDADLARWIAGRLGGV